MEGAIHPDAEDVIDLTDIEEDEVVPVFLEETGFFEPGEEDGRINAGDGGAHSGAYLLDPICVPELEDIVVHDKVEEVEDEFCFMEGDGIF